MNSNNEKAESLILAFAVDNRIIFISNGILFKIKGQEIRQKILGDSEFWWLQEYKWHGKMFWFDNFRCSIIMKWSLENGIPKDISN